jgi:hypothetical protein
MYIIFQNVKKEVTKNNRNQGFAYFVLFCYIRVISTPSTRRMLTVTVGHFSGYGPWYLPAIPLYNQWSLVHKTTYAPMVYMSLFVMIYGVARCIWHLPFGLMPLNSAQKNSRYIGHNPLPLALVMYLHASKTLRTGSINHRFIIAIINVCVCFSSGCWNEY